MRAWIRRAACAALVLAVAAPGLRAQSWSAEQQEVWSVVQAQWDAAMAEDATWTDRFLTDDFAGWSREAPAPRDKASEERWSRYGFESGSTLIQELFPMSIVVHGNTAVAHYVYSTATEDRDGERRTVHGRYTDTLVRDGDGWRFLAWHGGDDPSDD